MNRNLAIALLLATVGASSFADDITVDTTPFVSTATRAQVQDDLNAFRQSGVNPWSTLYSPVAQFSSQRTRAAVTADYANARSRVAAFTGEDSGSAYLAARQGNAAASTVAGQPRNPQ